MAKGIVAFDEAYCKGCSLCVDICPKGIIALDAMRVTPKGYHPASVEDMDKCTACMSCALMCPDSAISVERLS
ncbi:MAG: 4Fe-4S binding protein [Eubacteriaceae bacterium]|jgi:2-oxoglutarate ferredoxin oxidoreductase subunit delta|nr:4Fe-4S binding protein [Eubacteriaceae bacterium]